MNTYPKNSSSAKPSPRFYLLDISRACAALFVVVWHFSHFYYSPGGDRPADYNAALSPFYDFLTIAYTHGGAAVQFFFCLSGFIFFWLYAEKIRTGQVSAKKFASLRFSRLYPLHLLTLLIVAGLQFSFLKLNGHFSVYFENDLKHFFLNLFLVSHWGMQDGWSYNAPIWSVSLEVFAYISFFIVARLGLVKLWQVILIIALSYPVSLLYTAFGQIIFCFFVGGGTYLVFKLIQENINKPLIKWAFILSVFAVVIAAYLYIFPGYQENKVKDFVTLQGVIFPGIIFVLAMIQVEFKALGKRFFIFGELTYSIYLLHFPVQLALIGFSEFFNFNLVPGEGLFLGYVGSVLLLSYLVYSRFEVPVRDYLRRRLS